MAVAAQVSVPTVAVAHAPFSACAPSAPRHPSGPLSLVEFHLLNFCHALASVDPRCVASFPLPRCFLAPGTIGVPRRACAARRAVVGGSRRLGRLAVWSCVGWCLFGLLGAPLARRDAGLCVQ